MTLLGDPEDLADAADLLGAEDQHRDDGDGDEEALHGVRPDHRLQPALDTTMRVEDFSNNQQLIVKITRSIFIEKNSLLLFLTFSINLLVNILSTMKNHDIRTKPLDPFLM